MNFEFRRRDLAAPDQRHVGDRNYGGMCVVRVWEREDWGDDDGGRRLGSCPRGAVFEAGRGGLPVHEHPAAKALRKQAKSWTLSSGAPVEPSQFAKLSPAAKRLRKQPKSMTLRMGVEVEPSQLA
jgi:hypothetical protein